VIFKGIGKYFFDNLWIADEIAACPYTFYDISRPKKQFQKDFIEMEP